MGIADDVVQVNQGAGTPIAGTVQANGTATAPGAGVAFATTPSLPAGTYRITVYYQLSGTAETAVLNVKLLDSGGTFPTFVFPSAGNGNYGPFTLEAAITAGATVKLAAVGAALAGSVYSGGILATRIA